MRKPLGPPSPSSTPASPELAPSLSAEEIDRRYARYRWTMIVTLIATYGVAYTCRLGLSVVKKPLIDGGIFSAEDLGLIGAAFLYGYGFGKLGNGFLADRLPVRVLLPLGIFLSAAVNLVMGSSTALWVAVALWGVNGLFQGVGAPASVVALTRWFSNNERGRYYGVWSTAHAIGEGLTFIGTSALVAFAGWRAGFWGPGVLCAVAAVATYYFVTERPESVGLPPVATWRNDHPPVAAGQPMSTGRAQLAILKMPALWIVGLASACMYVSRYAINSWGVLYLQEVHGYDLIEAGGLIGANTIAGVAGCAAYGFLSDYLFQSRRPPLTLIFGVVEILSLGLIFFGPKGNTLLLTVGFVVYGFTLSGLLAVLGGLFAVDIAPKKAAGAVMGFVGVFSYIGAGIQESVSGYLVGKGTLIVDGVRHYDFGPAVAFWLGASVLSMLLAATLWRVRAAD